MRRVSPIECSIRWHQVLRQRQYCVPGPNSLWHMDGHHSLIRWRFVIHGSIDGYLRCIKYLHCATNNRAATDFSLFHQATTGCGVPSRVQGHLIIINALSGCGEMCTDVLLLLSTVFSENQEILDPSNQLWNQHPLYTEHHWSPHRVYGVLDPNRVGQTGIRDIVDPVPTEGLHSFGIDYYGPLSTNYDDDTVEILETAIPISEEQLQYFLHQIETLPNHNHGMDTFMEVREHLGLIGES